MSSDLYFSISRHLSDVGYLSFGELEGLLKVPSDVLEAKIDDLIDMGVVRRSYEAHVIVYKLKKDTFLKET